MHLKDLKGVTNVLQTLVIFKKDSRQLVAAFKFDTFTTNMYALVQTPGLEYILTLETDIYYKDGRGVYYVKENIKSLMKKDV